MSMTENLDRSPDGTAGSDGNLPEDRKIAQTDHGLAPDDPLAELIRLVKQEDPFTEDRKAQKPGAVKEPIAPSADVQVETKAPEVPAIKSTLNIAPLIEPSEIEPSEIEPSDPAPEPDQEPMVEKPAVSEQMPRAMAAQILAAKPSSAPQSTVTQSEAPAQTANPQESFVPPVLEIRPPAAKRADNVADVESYLSVDEEPVLTEPVRFEPEPEIPVDSASYVSDEASLDAVHLEPMDLDAALLAARQVENFDENDFRESLIEPSFSEPIIEETPTRPEQRLDPTQYISAEIASPFEDPAFADDTSEFDDSYFQLSDADYVEPAPVPLSQADSGQIESQLSDVSQASVFHYETAPEIPTEGTASVELGADFTKAIAPQRRRGAIFAVGLLLGLAVVGGSLAFAFLGDSQDGQNTGNTPVLRANSDPAKVAPDNPGGQAIQHQNNLVYQGSGDGSAPSNEQLVPREEQIVGVPKVTPKNSTRPGLPTATLPLPLQPGAAGTQTSSNSAPVPLGTTPGTTAIRPTSPPTSNVTPAPRRVRTVVVRPDGTVVANEAAPVSAASPPAVAAAPTIPLPATRPTQPQDNQVSQPSPAAVATQPQQQQQPAPQVAAQQPANPVPASNAPVRLTPPSRTTNQTVVNNQTNPATTPAVQATTPAAVPATGSGQFVVQVAARRSEEQANAAFSELRSQYRSQLGRYGPLVQRADLGDRGVYYRLRIGPMRSQSEAQQVCDNLKSAGLSDCLVRPR